MLVSEHPTIRLHLQPHFNSEAYPTHISTTYTLPTTISSASSLIFHYRVFGGNVPSHPYSPSSIHAIDSAGLVPFTFTDPDDDNLQSWVPSRPLQGPTLTLRLEVFPRQVDRSTPIGSRIDLRHDHQGLVGVGRWFLPLPRYVTKHGSSENDDIEQHFSNILTWDISDSPSGTRTVCTYGEGSGPIIQVGNRHTFLDCVFMLGPVKSYPTTSAPSSCSPCTTYWLAEALPENLARTKDFNAALFPRMVHMFGLDPAETTYRVFFRNAIRGYGGAGMIGSFVLDYSDESDELDDDELKFMFAHEMTHGFAALFPEDDGEPNIWYADGLADWYACVLPYRFGIENESCALRALNYELSGYYTSPFIHIPMKDALSSFYKGWYAEKVAYFRGFAYFAAIDHRLRRLAGTTDPQQAGPLDEIVVELGNRMQDGAPVVQADWLQALGRWLDNRFECAEELQRILSGRDTVTLENAYFLSPGRPFRSVGQRGLQFGFDQEALYNGVVKQLVTDSEAGKAGLKIGDRIVGSSRPDICYGDPEQRFWVDVKRNSGKRRIEWLPRAAKGVTVWQSCR